jgi:hypothetical protein
VASIYLISASTAAQTRQIQQESERSSRGGSMQANPNTDHLSEKGAVRPSIALNKLPEYAYRAAILLAMMLLLWTVA